GGNARNLANLAITMVLAGLWYGASWPLAAWGLLHGLYLTIHRLCAEQNWLTVIRNRRWFRPSAIALTFLAVTLSWPLFRAPDFATAFAVLQAMAGFHGVARPQGKASHYLSAVRDAGTVYRSGRGRGYSSNAELDFHTDSADLVLLSCYNVAAEGGESLVTSSVAAHAALAAEDPALAALLHAPFHFSRQEEQAPDEEPFYPNPIFDEAEGVLCSKWNRNRLMSAQRIPGVPALTDAQRHALDRLDALLRDPRLMYRMYLQPGDMQLLNNHVTLHSRTEFVDHAEPERRRTLFRLWLAPPDWPRLPESWRPAYRAVERGTVRGGIRGQAYDAACRAYEARQAAALGMRLPEEPVAG
ncbi:MAG: TauD/TfdA family dioxygenase, partial [Rhodospirillales bacterium]|nr:TauD/TfdA family dioxygenase [Rhodospirillales bacterium]